MKKGLKLLAVSVLSISSLVSCQEGGNTTSDSASGTTGTKWKAGLVALHDTNSTYDKNFIDAFEAACNKMGFEAVIKTGIPETSAAYDAAAELADENCQFVFADSFGHESHILKAAKEFPNVQFSHATGTSAHVNKVANFHNAFASIYEGRYLAGVAAGMKLKEMIDNKTLPSTAKMDGDNYKIGYVGAFPYAEVISGYTSYFLGVRSIVSNVTMEVTYTSSWYDETGERTGANTLITDGCAIISQHADSWGAPNACETAKVPNISYNGSTASKCPNTYIISSKVNWEPYFEYALGKIKDGKGSEIPYDYTGTLGSDFTSGSVALSEIGTAAASGTQAKLEEVAGKLRNGTLKVFDCANFTVNGQHLTTQLADIDGDYKKDTEAITTKNGITYYDESSLRSAPYFDIIIDGITELNNN